MKVYRVHVHTVHASENAPSRNPAKINLGYMTIHCIRCILYSYKLKIYLYFTNNCEFALSEFDKKIKTKKLIKTIYCIQVLELWWVIHTSLYLLNEHTTKTEMRKSRQERELTLLHCILVYKKIRTSTIIKRIKWSLVTIFVYRIPISRI